MTDRNYTSSFKRSTLHDDICKEVLETATYETNTLMEIVYDFACPPKGWEGFFNREDVKEMMQGISDQLQFDSLVQGLGINQNIGWVFRAFHMVPPDKVKAIIMGQDPSSSTRVSNRALF